VGQSAKTSLVAKFERRLITAVTRLAKHYTATAVGALSDYHDRHIAGQAASVSFYAIFSIFPLLAFSVYLVGQLVGDEARGDSTAIVLQILRDYVPAMQHWIEKGLFGAISGYTATNWVNAALLGWSGLGLFEALLEGIESLPEAHPHGRRAHVTQAALGVLTLALFAVFIVTVAFCEVVGKASQTPFWLRDLPFELQDVLYYGARSHVLLGVMSVGIVMAIYKILMPVKLSLRSAFVGGLVFTGLHLLSRSAYWIYLHYNKHEIDTSYGAFSALILVMLWVHFSVSCLLYGALFALHLDEAREQARRKHEHREKTLHERHDRIHKKAA
jgi:membrane protein